MKSLILVLIIFIAALNISGCGFMSKKYTKTESSEYRISSLNKVKISLENVNGNINVHKSTDIANIVVKASMEIKVKKKDLDKPFTEIKINIDTNSEVIKISSELNKHNDNEIFHFTKERKVNYDIYLPENIEIDIENINGKISSERISNNMKIELVNGSVDLENCSGKLNCDITNGDLKGKFDSTKGMDISIINGSTTLNLNNFMNANIKAETMNGKIQEDNLQFRDVRKEKKSFKGKLGNTESNTDINIETTNGKIKLTGNNEI